MKIYGVYMSYPHDLSSRAIELQIDHLYTKFEDAEKVANIKNNEVTGNNKHFKNTWKTDRYRTEYFVEAIEVKDKIK